ncbi:hypothetical protein CERSUDRAFT_118087 [Gelatoporia subvermispora B]|uniref:Peptidase C14 caspase domain-containing protein n=1 Tax=Ceriporiopsis subvermispora (strain B) TaxID=914234 RepID=M2R3M5_CERS8|nr:hypothetical protein CERSUDRAFT_118087 [Gelatoporia subvermispora B]
MWNDPGSGYPGNSRYGPPSGPPPGGNAFGFPSPDVPPQGTRGFTPGYAPSYGPPPGAPPSGYGGPPPFQPPAGPPPDAGYPGQGYEYHHHHHHHHHPEGGYAPPPGPPLSGYGGPPPIPTRQYEFQPPPGPPGEYGTYAAPDGPPPPPPTSEQRYGPVFEGANHQQQQPFFQYSQCTGKRKALCIGINYIGQSAELKGCINDAHNVKRFLIDDYGYLEDDIVMLTDDAPHHRQIPTQQNMLAAMEWLVRDAQPHDSLFFHYSGHGGQTKDLDGDEEDGYDEVIYPVDFQTSGQIIDDVLHDVLVKPLPPGCRLTAIFDSCHSGSALDLPYLYSTEGKIKEPNLAREAGQGLLNAVSSYARGDMTGVFGSMKGLLQTVSSGGSSAARTRTQQTKTSPADVISWSGCKDSQTSADTFEDGQATGAMSYAFISTLRQNRQQSYQQLLTSIRGILQGKYSQIPQLSSSHPMDTRLLFIC